MAFWLFSMWNLPRMPKVPGARQAKLSHPPTVRLKKLDNSPEMVALGSKPDMRENPAQPFSQYVKRRLNDIYQNPGRRRFPFGKVGWACFAGRNDPAVLTVAIEPAM
jgi:hypothetical protein